MMRNLDERMAEITRRSEEILRQRKRRRNHILMGCVPMMLLICMYPAFILPAKISPGSEYEADGTVEMESWESDSIAWVYVEVEILGAGDVRHITNLAEVSNIYHVIRSICMPDYTYGFAPGSTEGESHGDEGQDDAAEDDVTGATGAASSYTVIFSTADGDKTVYTLSENDLVNESTGEKIVLTDMQLENIKKALGLY